MENSSKASSSNFLSIVPPKKETSTITETISASITLQIINYWKTKGIGVGKCISSRDFSIGGYDWCLDYYPDGKKEGCKDYISIYLRLRSAAKSHLNVQVRFLIVDKDGHPSCMRRKVEFYCSNNVNHTKGKPKFLRRNQLENSKYLEDDCFNVQCHVSFKKGSHDKVRMANPVVVPSTNLHKHLCQLLEREDGTDVTFDVGRKTFHAHRCVLAARSPVFSAELFGSMKESKQRTIKISDIEVPVFEAMLHFIYSDSIDEVETVMKKSDTAMMAQHLLAAADRYGVERLKAFCESKLYEKMELHNVATTLALAEQHNCSQLKEACFRFISPPEVLAAVVQTDGFKHLIRSCPLILKELYEKHGEDGQ